MVMMDVKIVEFKNKDKLRELGIQWDASANGPMVGIAGDLKVSSLRNQSGGFYVLPSQETNIQGFDTLQRPIAPFRSYAGLASVLYSRINLMASDGDATVLAQPQLSARSGREAMMNVGGRIPLQVSSGFGERRVQFERYGVQVHITPWVDPNGMINSKIKAEVSEPDGSMSVDGLPAFREKVVETVFNVTSGQTMVLSGLLQKGKSKSVTKVPFLGDIPLLGALFRSTRETENDSEVAIFVTPRVVDASSASIKKAWQEAADRIRSYIGPTLPVVPESDEDAASRPERPTPEEVQR
jgi:pilus assembly protein CpaC